MFIRWIRNRKLLALGLGAALAAAVAGCGGQPTDSSDVNVVVPEPNVNVSSKTTGAKASAPATATTGASAPESSASTAGTAAGGWGTLKGQVVFTGTPPPEKVLEEKGKAEKDPDMCAVDKPIVSERIVIDDATKGVKNVLVYLPRPTAVNDDAKKAVLAKPAEFDQKKCVFEPHVLGLMTGTTVTLKSSDPKSHNVNIKLKKTLFNQPIGAGNPVKLPLQDAENTPGAVVCDIHPWMTSWWMVLNHPYFAVTDEKGNYEIKNAPAGNQKVVVWQEFVKGGGFVTPSSGENVDIKANDTTSKDFTIDSGKLLPVN
jgi:plastocyanin